MLYLILRAGLSREEKKAVLRSIVSVALVLGSMAPAQAQRSGRVVRIRRPCPRVVMVRPANPAPPPKAAVPILPAPYIDPSWLSPPVVSHNFEITMSRNATVNNLVIVDDPSDREDVSTRRRRGIDLVPPSPPSLVAPGGGDVLEPAVPLRVVPRAKPTDVQQRVPKGAGLMPPWTPMAETTGRMDVTGPTSGSPWLHSPRRLDEADTGRNVMPPNTPSRR